MSLLASQSREVTFEAGHEASGRGPGRALIPPTSSSAGTKEGRWVCRGALRCEMNQKANEEGEVNVFGSLCAWGSSMQEVSRVYRFPVGLGVSAGRVTGRPLGRDVRGGVAKTLWTSTVSLPGLSPFKASVPLAV